MSLSLEDLQKIQKTLVSAFALATEKMEYANKNTYMGNLDAQVAGAVGQTGLALLEVNRQMRDLETEVAAGKPKLPRQSP